MKDHLRDYATSAFQFYSRVGGSENYIQNLIADMQRQKSAGIPKPTEAAALDREKVIEKRASELTDLETVEKVIEVLKCIPDGECIRKAIELVYFIDNSKPIQRGDICARVQAAALKLYASERSVYYWLKVARVLFAKERGLRI